MQRKLKRVYDGTILIWNGENPDDIYDTDEEVEIPKELLEIAAQWKTKSDARGDVGCCVLGAGMHFKYKGNKYEMMPQSCWQGEGSWTPYVGFVREELEKIGATEINYEWGLMD